MLLTRSRVSLTGKPKVRTRKGDKHRRFSLWKLEEGNPFRNHINRSTVPQARGDHPVNALSLYHDLKVRGGYLEAQGKHLKVDAPAGVVTEGRKGDRWK